MNARSLSGAWLLLAIAACSGADPATDAPDPETQAVEEAAALCMSSIQGHPEVRAEALAKLQDVTAKYPGNARAFFHLGMCSTAAGAEDGDFGAFLHSEPALSRASELAPDDVLYLGNLWLTRLNLALGVGNAQNIQTAIDSLIAAADADKLNTFVLAVGLTQLELDTGYPQLAAERFAAYAIECPELDYCRNSDLVIHHDSAMYMQLGDAWARIGQKEMAVQAYAGALAAEGADTWSFLPDAEAWAAAIDERLSLYADGDPANDPGYFLSGVRTCTGCHG